MMKPGKTNPAARTALAAVLLLAGCSRDKDDAVVARVDGTRITAKELQQAQDRIASGEAVDAATRRKILESIVLNRAMARVEEDEMNKDESREVDREVDAYRDQVLSRRYLVRHATPSPLSEGMIRDYYDQHPEQFGGGAERSYEMVLTTDAVSDQKRDDVLAAMNKLTAEQGWEAKADALAAQKLPVAYRQGSDRDTVLHERIRGVLGGMHKDSKPQVAMVEGQLYLVRVTAEKQRPAKPFTEVRYLIERALVAKQLKEAVEKAAPEVLGKVKVEYVEDGK